MIVRRLREQRNWSQEQLAQLSGLSLRTIQRVEAGSRASLETMNALASTLEVDITKLKEGIVVIEKDSDAWQAEPWFVRAFLVGVKRRSHMVFLEIGLIVLAIVYWALNPASVTVPMVFLFPYFNAKLLAYVDRKAYW